MMPMKIFSTLSKEEFTTIRIPELTTEVVSEPSVDTLTLLCQLARIMFVAPVKTTDKCVVFMN
ncbi:hypothetical protein A9168_01065 [Macellibacteroides sp. HH-ZS]|nr:hypothetical protein A9168_01065 [Macellibacteroides sp. HH-ZS]